MQGVLLWGRKKDKGKEKGCESAAKAKRGGRGKGEMMGCICMTNGIWEADGIQEISGWK